MALANQPRRRLAVLCGLYLIQGMPTGLISIGLAAYLAGKGLPVADVAQVLAVSWIPWGFKCLFGPLVDRFSGSSMGRRRPWMLAAQCGMALMLIVMIAVPALDERTTLLMVLIYCHNTFSSLQDVAVDALAVDLLESREHGRANGLMWSAKLSGIGLGGAGLGTVLAGRIAATQFALFMALSNLCNVLGSIVIVPLDRFLDYSGIFIAGACFTGFTALLLRDLPERTKILAAPS